MARKPYKHEVGRAVGLGGRLRIDPVRPNGRVELVIGRIRLRFDRGQTRHEFIAPRFAEHPDSPRDWTKAEAWPFGLKSQRRPRRKPPGGEPLPVEPRPTPTPLIGGAEAPLD